MQLNENDPIKIVYNWIGPRGPIINTDVPNILSLACVSEGTNTNSTRFWTDDIHWRVFMHNGNYPFAPAFHMEEGEVFLYPFTLSWRTDFTNYFLNDNGILEFSHTPNHIIHQVRHHNGFFLLDYSPEAWVQDGQLKAIHSYFGNYHNIPMGKIIYITGCMNAEELYNNWCNRNGIPDNPMHRISMVSFPVSQHAISMHINGNADEPEYDTEYIPKKLFLCWNRRFRQHRTNLALALDKAGLVDRSYYSMSKTDPEISGYFFKNTVDIYSNPLLGIKPENAVNFINKLPLIIDGETEIQKMCGDFDRAAKDFYKNSLVSIITETNYELSELTATEKTWKPAKEKHPFIMVGTAGALRTLQDFGFQTFHEFWDESYDDEEDPKMRLYKIVEVCKEIGSWDTAEILDFKRRVKPIVEHNFNMLKTNTAKKVADKIRKEISGKVK